MVGEAEHVILTSIHVDIPSQKLKDELYLKLGFLTDPKDLLRELKKALGPLASEVADSYEAFSYYGATTVKKKSLVFLEKQPPSLEMNLAMFSRQDYAHKHIREFRTILRRIERGHSLRLKVIPWPRVLKFEIRLETGGVEFETESARQILKRNAPVFSTLIPAAVGVTSGLYAGLSPQEALILAAFPTAIVTAIFFFWSAINISTRRYRIVLPP